MHELEAIVLAHANSIHKEEPMFLATIVNTVGSTYRQKGAKMLVRANGEMVGTLSGGCVENDVFEYTKQIVNEPLLIDYDATKVEDDLIWGFGLGCNGAIQILLEKLDDKSPISPIQLISHCLSTKSVGAIATLISTKGSIPLKLGSRLVVYPDGTTQTDISDHALIEVIENDVLSAKKNRKSTVINYQFASGTIEVFIDVIHPPNSLVIFGAGRDALPVVTSAKAIGWHVTVVDCRVLQKTYQRFAIADHIILARSKAIAQHLSIDEHTATVVMTHNYFDDLDIIKFLFSTNAPYVGVMGSKSRIAKLIEQLNPTQTQLKTLHSPIGLDIGAETPAEIASAIIAEIQAVFAKRNAGFNKHHGQPLHSKDRTLHKSIYENRL
ncbi:XdhC family protein [Vacuolonema iberomarrocanum]|uniref:XdhC family protein n=1 Tax=Vacuolonema iberomarrocanum TaxID=3454632 RepID=UPI001A02AF32|nr:XdhC family protein [filamentous cyanobacterium LEGE 07170]